MKTLTITALLLLSVVVHADTVRSRIGHGKPADGQLKPGEMATATNSMSFYVGDRNSNSVLVGIQGVADTNAVNAAVANRAVTNAWNTLTLAITNAPPTGTNLVFWTDDGTNLYFKAWP